MRKTIAWILAAVAVLVTVGIAVWLYAKNGRLQSDDSETAGIDENSDVLYEDGAVLIRRITKEAADAVNSTAVLTAVTEKEMLEGSDLILRVRIAKITNIAVEEKERNLTTEGCIMTMDVLDVLKGEPGGSGSVKVFFNKYVHTSLEDLNQALQYAETGTEGILFAREFPANSTDPVRNLADCFAGLYAHSGIWATEKGLSFDKITFADVERSWTLDEAAVHIRAVLNEGE